MIFEVFGKLISREVSTKELAGPVGIIPASGIIALQGLSPMLNFMGLISINLAVLNLFPLIITDGGVLLFLLLEVVRRRPLSIRTQTGDHPFRDRVLHRLFSLRDAERHQPHAAAVQLFGK